MAAMIAQYDLRSSVAYAHPQVLLSVRPHEKSGRAEKRELAIRARTQLLRIIYREFMVYNNRRRRLRIFVYFFFFFLLPTLAV
jgi:hypothetical protein